MEERQVTHPVIIAAFAVWCGVVWRLRGGALTTLLRINLGTDGARGFAGVAIAMPLAWLAHDWQALALAPALFAGLKAIGWGPFQGMGLEKGQTPEKSWLRWPPHEIGLRDGSIGMDVVGMGEAGVLAMVFPSVVIAFLIWPPSILPFAVLLAGVLFPVPYLIARFVALPTLPRFAAGQAWGEVGAALAFSLCGG